MPAVEKRVKLHKEKRPIFSRFQLEEQIDQIYEKRVPLPSGGSLIIEPTEALVSIDVNSGKSSGERGIEDTAYKANMEAAEEVARQLRLRDLGGLIVIDFIDMRENKHNSEVEKTLKNALKMDKARVNVGRISQFGIMEMSRQRIAKTLNDAIHLECPHCEGRGKVKSVEAMAVSFLRKVHAAAAKGTVGEVRGGLPLEVAYYLLNRKKRELTQIENDYEIEVTVKGKTSFLLNQLELEIVKREKPHLEDVLKSEAEAEEAHKTVIPHAPVPQPVTDDESKTDAGAPVEGGKKRKRRKKKKKASGDPHMDATGATQADVDSDHSDDSPSEEVPEAGDVSAADAEESAADLTVKPKKRKRRRSRGKANKSSEHPGEESPDVTISEPLVPEQPAHAETSEHASAEVKPKRARTPRKKKQDAVAETPVAPEPVVAIVTVPEPPPGIKKTRKAAVKKSIPVVVTPEAESDPPKKVARPRRNKKDVETP
jgi:ribonuclease E